MGWLETVKAAGDAIEALRSAEANAKFADVRMEMAKLAEENARLREELLALREKAGLREQMTARDNLYWRSTGTGEDGPFCPTCWDGDKKAVRLVDEDRYKLLCPVCKEDRWKPDGQARWRADMDASQSRRRERDRQW